MIKGAPATAEATAIPGASATTEMQNYPASDSDPSGASDVVLLCQITGSDPASLDHCLMETPNEMEEKHREIQFMQTSNLLGG